MDTHDWLNEIECLKRKLNDKEKVIERLASDLKSKDDLVLQQSKEMKELQAKLKDLQSEEVEEKKRLQRIIVKREDTIDQIKYDLRVLDRAHKDLQADYRKLSESMKSIRKHEEELKECEKQKLLARQKQEALQHDIKERVRIEETERERIRGEIKRKRQQEKEFESFIEYKRKRV